MSWSWRKILQLRPSIREFIWRKIGNGSSTSIWFDKWCHEGPLASRVSPRDIHRAGLTLSSQVGDVIRDGDWVWPRVLLDKYQFLNECTVPLSNNCDTLEWRLYDGTVKRFSVAQVWECIRPRADKVPWVDLIWFAMGIPRHAFNLWLIINHKLKTQDRVSIWDYSNVLGSTCPLCEATPDSHEHLFFICPFANSVWSRMKVKAGLGRVSHNIYDIVDHFGGIARRKTTHVVIAKLVVAASAYFIWQERNWRLFKKSKRSIDQVVSCISSSVRMKLLSCAFKRITEGVLYVRLWDLPNSIFR
ncbi:RNA-directed DNA polymerase, eukaryota, reverse transcriptase zinc-binding domain protein [Tanacetum coccineum]